MNKSAPRIATPKTDKIKEIIDRAHSYEIYEEGIGRYRFVDRDNEIRKILKSSEYLFLGGRITVLYGSKGCGKSTLFEAVSHAVKDSDFEVILIKSVSDAERKSEEIDKIDKNKKIFIVADEVRADSPEHLSSFKQWLESFANELREINRGIVEKGGGGIAVIALTSDALAAKISEVVGNKVNWVLMWNLPRNASEKLISQIRLQHRVARELGISSEEAREILWRLAGGNPRELEQIWGMGILSWVKTTASRLGNIVDDAVRDLGEDLVWDNLKRILEGVDGMGRVKIFNYLLRGNIAFYTNIGTPISELPREQWIGERYAYQIPAYYYILKTMAKKKSWDISPEEVIREAMG